MFTEAPLTGTEKRLLASYAGVEKLIPRILQASWIIGCFAAMIYFPIRLFWLWSDIIVDSAAYNLTLIAVSCICSIYYSKTYLRDQFRKPSKESPFLVDLEGGVANVEQFNVRRVIEIEEYEDEGAGFLLELERGGVLCVIGQDYYEYMSDIELEGDEPDLRGNFPHTIIEYRYGPNSGLPLNVTGVGDSLRPFQKIPSRPKFAKNKKGRGYVYVGPEDGTFYPGSLEDICRQFDYTPVPIS